MLITVWRIAYCYVWLDDWTNFERVKGKFGKKKFFLYVFPDV